MWPLDEPRGSGWGETALPIFIGALGGLAIGVFVSGRSRAVSVRVREQARERARNVTRRFTPGRTRRSPAEAGEFSDLEDRVLDLFRADELLSERGIDVGAIGTGIIELSGSVRTPEEAHQAVEVARRAEGVNTVVNRMAIDSEARHADDVRRRFEQGDDVLRETQWQGRRSGMGASRQGEETEPARPDDAQPMRERALAEADRDQFQREGYSRNPRTGERPEVMRPEGQTDFPDDELDNQYPDGRGPEADVAPAEERYPEEHIGEGAKPGVERRLEEAGLEQEQD